MKTIYTLLLAALTSIGWGATDDAPRTYYKAAAAVTNAFCEFNVSVITWTTTALTVTTSNRLSWAAQAGDSAYFWSGATNLWSTGGPYRVISVSSAANGQIVLASQQSSSRASSLADTTARLRIVHKYSRATVVAKKYVSSNTWGNNTGNIYIGTGTNSAVYALAPGEELSFSPPRVHDLNDWWLAGPPTATGDGVFIIYWP